jgi:hypothetical protein
MSLGDGRGKGARFRADDDLHPPDSTRHSLRAKRSGPHVCAGCAHKRRLAGIRRLARPLLVALCATVALGACSSTANPNKPAAVGALKVSSGQCLLVAEGLGAQVGDLPVIDCTKPHSHEIFATVIDKTDQVYPGMATLEQLAETKCYGEFEGYVGISPFDSSLFVTWIVPSLGSWNDKSDRSILCVLGRKDGGQLDKSAKGIKL